MEIFKASPDFPARISEHNGNWTATGGRLDDGHEMTKQFSPAVRPLRAGFLA